MGPDVNDFCYTDEILDDLEVSLSSERLGTYLEATGEDREEAVSGSMSGIPRSAPRSTDLCRS